MKKWMKFVLVIAVFSVIFVAGCKDETTEPTENEFDILAEYLVANDLDFPDMLADWIITASAVHAAMDDYFIIDARTQAAYDVGHIPGAVFADASTILDVAATAGRKTIVVHCFKGIGATRLVTALRLSGYTTAKSMQFGMSAWGLADADDGAVYDKWTGATSDIALDYPADWLLTAQDPAEVNEFGNPALSTGEEAGADILADRVAALLTDGYGYASAPDILTMSDDYFINNYWDEASWNLYGHIKGAYRINSLSLETGGINNLDPDETIVTYCWTSQTSGMITAYLTVLGYDAQSLITGTNGLIWTNLQSHKWSSETGIPGENAPGEYELETP